MPRFAFTLKFQHDNECWIELRSKHTSLNDIFPDIIPYLFYYKTKLAQFNYTMKVSNGRVTKIIEKEIHHDGAFDAGVFARSITQFLDDFKADLNAVDDLTASVRTIPSDTTS